MAAIVRLRPNRSERVGTVNRPTAVAAEAMAVAERASSLSGPRAIQRLTSWGLMSWKAGSARITEPMSR